MGAIRQLVDELRRRGVTVNEWPGWDGRGNEDVGQITPHGAVLHHTATAYGSAFAGLVSSTRPDLLGGCLCNFAGNSDGSVTVIASGLAWHAGTGAGPSLGPLAPYRNAMNRNTVGLEIVYPGDKPMTDAQYATALVFSRAVADLFGGGDIECVRAHAETNGRGGDGKWDPGFGPSKTIDMAAFRKAAAASKSQEVDVPLSKESVPVYKVPGGTDTRATMGADEALGRTVEVGWRNYFALQALASAVASLATLVAKVLTREDLAPVREDLAAIREDLDGVQNTITAVTDTLPTAEQILGAVADGVSGAVVIGGQLTIRATEQGQ